MPARHYSKKIPERINKLLTNDLVKMDTWAYQKYLPSILNQFTRKGNITDKQYQFLVKLEDKFIGSGREKLLKERAEQAEILLKEKEEWKKEYFGSIIEEKAKIVARYYQIECENKTIEWYKNIWEPIISGALPPRRGCMSMINNNYAKRVWEAWDKKPDYPINSLVQPRTKYKKNINNQLHDVEFAFVMKVNVAIPNAVSGGKQYLVLPKGKLEGIVCEERHLKKYRRKS